MTNTAVIYHEYKKGIPCHDGLASAWVAKKVFKEADFLPVSYDYQQAINVSNYTDLVILDFSFSSNIINQWKNENKKILLIDHHKTGLNNLSNLIKAVQSQNNNRIIFDLEECGATLTWKTLLSPKPMPAFLNYIKDRDTWRHELPYTHEIHAAISAIKPSFNLFDVLELMSKESLISYLMPLGAKRLKEKHQRILNLATKFYWGFIADYKVPIIDIDKKDITYTSDLCDHLCKKYPDAPFVAVKSHIKVSLRSDKNGLNTDVGAIAKRFGGGGHRNSAAYSIKAKTS